MRINYLTDTCYEQGTYFRWHNLALGMKALGHQVTVYSCDPNPDSKKRVEERDGIIYHITPGSYGMSLFGNFNHPLTSFKRLFIDYQKCDIVHSFQPFLGTYLIRNIIFRKKAKSIFIDWDDLWVNGLIRKEPQMSFQSKWHRTITNYIEHKNSKHAENFTVCSQYLKNLALERGAKKIHILHNGFWPYLIKDKIISRREMGLKEDALYAGFMGRTVNELDWCFEALSLVIPEHPNFRLALCGMPNNFEHLDKKLLNNIDYLGHLTPLQTRIFASSLDIGLLPLQIDNFNISRFPIKFSEYMAAGIPILCSSIGDLNLYIEKFPWIIDAGKTKESWKTAFQHLPYQIKENTLLKIDNNIIEESLSWLNISKKLEKLYLGSLS